MKIVRPLAALFLTATLNFTSANAQQQVIGAPPEASNMKLVGMSDLQARSAYQPTIHHQGDRWIAYIGHHGGSDEIPAPVNPMNGKAEPRMTPWSAEAEGLDLAEGEGNGDGGRHTSPS